MKSKAKTGCAGARALHRAADALLLLALLALALLALVLLALVLLAEPLWVSVGVLLC